MEIIETYLDQAGVKRRYIGYTYLAYAIAVYRPWMVFGGKKGLYQMIGDVYGKKWATIKSNMELALSYAEYVEEDELTASIFIRTACEILFE